MGFISKVLKKIVRPLHNEMSFERLPLYKLVKNNFVEKDELKKLFYNKEHLNKRAKENIESTHFLGKQIKITDSFWYLHSLTELFIDETYSFIATTKEPLIIDCGSNIGLSIIYFKRLYPEAKVIGFEPDKDIYKKLQHNVGQFNLSKLELHQKAIWVNNEPLLFQQNGSLGGHITSSESSNTIKIETIRLKDLLHQKVDFLKIDIEGPEYDIIKDCEELLGNVENIFIEYHSFHENEQMVGELIIMLKKSGFKIYIKEAWENMNKPFIEKKGPYFDLQLNIFGYRR